MLCTCRAQIKASIAKKQQQQQCQQQHEFNERDESEAHDRFLGMFFTCFTFYFYLAASGMCFCLLTRFQNLNKH